MVVAIICVLIVSILIIGVCVVYLVRRHNKNVDMIIGIVERQLNVNKAVLEKLSSENFNITKIYYVADGYTWKMDNSYRKMVLADNTNKKICLIDYNSGEYVIVEFKNFLNYEIYENGCISTTTNAVGTVYGGVGVGIANSETTNISKDLKLMLRINNFEKPQVTYHILSNHSGGVGISNSAELYKTCINSLQELLAFFEIVSSYNLHN